MSVLVLLSSSMFIRVSAAVSVLLLPLLLACVFTVHASDDDFIVIRFLASGSDTTGMAEDFMASLLLASGSGFGLKNATHSS